MGTPAPSLASASFAFPASIQQQELWREFTVSPASYASNLSYRCSLKGPLDHQHLERAFRLLIQRHESLRTSLRKANVTLEQIVSGGVKFSLPHSKAADDAVVEALCRREAWTAFDLTSAPLLRARLIERGVDDHVLCITLHSAIADGWSISVLVRELGEAYAAAKEGRAPAWQDVQIQLADFVLWQGEVLASDEGKKQLVYWRKQLEGFVPLRWKVESEIASLESEIVSEVLPRELSDAVRNWSNQHGVTYYSTVLAALKVYLFTLSGQTDIGITTQVTGRDSTEVESTIGSLANTVLLRSRIDSARSFADFVKDVRDLTYDALANQHVPWTVVTRSLRRDSDRFSAVNFISQRAFLAAQRFSDIELTPIPSVSVSPQYDLNVFMVERQEGWRLSVEFRKAAFSRQQALAFLADYRSFLAHAIATPQTVSEIARGAHVTFQVPLVRDAVPASVNAPASAAQQRFWMVEQLSPGATILSAAYEMTGPIDIERLQSSFAQVIAESESLRTSVSEVDGQIIQTIAASAPLDVEVHDLTAVPEPERDAAVQASRAEVLSAPLDSATPPLMRCAVILIAPERSLLVLAISHLIADGWSVGVLLRKVTQQYVAASVDTTSIQYLDHATEENLKALSPEYKVHRDFWTATLHPPLVPLALPYDSASTDSGRGMQRLQLSDEAFASMKKLAKGNNCTPFITCLALFSSLVRGYTGSQDFVIGSPIARRNPENESTIGPLAQPICFRINAAGATFSELLGQTRQIALDTFDHADFPFEIVTEDVMRHTSQPPFFQLYFIYQPAFIQRLQLGERTSLSPLPGGVGGSTATIQLACIEREQGLRLQLEYDATLISAASAQRLLEHFVDLLGRCAADPDFRLDGVSQLSNGDSCFDQGLRGERKQRDIVTGAITPPADDHEKHMIELWQQVFGVQGIGATSDFFDLGGKSLLAVRLFREIEKGFGKRLSINTLVQSRTPRALCGLLRAPQSSTDRSFNAISMQAGPKPQLVWVPGGRGISILAFREVTALLADRSITGVEFALPVPGTDPKTVGARAEELVSWLVERGGPYHLAGFCLGGFVAYEAAQILRRRGLNVGMLALINCYDVPTTAQRLASRAASGVKRMASPKIPASAEQEQERYVPDDSEVRNNRIMKMYKPAKYDGKIHIFASETSSFSGLPRKLDPRMNFMEFAASSEVHYLPGDHEGILAGNGARQLARLMQAAMQAAETD